jgi:cytoskeletal protein CcmA (bactofilin family)
MFGSSKNTPGFASVASSKSALTGLERAKLERTREPIGTDDIPPMPGGAVFPAELPAAVIVQKRGPSMPERAKQSADQESAAHLYVGANIRLKGEITGCDLMRVEGTFEGIAQARQLILCPGGAFLGTAQIEEAEIEGAFDGTLNVRGRLYLRNKGHIRGTFSYGQLEIERGGEIDGRINPFEKPAAAADAAAKPAEVPRPVVAPAAPAAKPALVQQPVRPLQPPVSAARPALNGSQPLNGPQPSPVPAE